jgi:hypothetical protein
LVYTRDNTLFLLLAAASVFKDVDGTHIDGWRGQVVDNVETSIAN